MSVGRIVVFLSVVCALVFGTHYYLWMRLVRDPGWSAPLRTLGTGALIVLGALIPLSMVLWRVASPSISKPVAWAGYLWMGVLFLLLMTLFFGDLIRSMSQIAAAEPPDEARRSFLARVLALGAGALGFSLSGYALWEGLAGLQIKHRSVTLKKLAPELDGLRIVQLTDVHVGPTIGREFIQGIVDKVNTLAADLVVITGDLIDGSVEELGTQVSPLADLQAKDGVFFVTGNHEYYAGADEWLAFLPSLGIRPLRNERVEVSRQGAAIDLAGIDDSDAHRFGSNHGADLKGALAGRDESRPVVLLAHRPRAFHEAKDCGVDLQISGHTHGGQIFPFGFVTRLVEPFIQGLHRRGDSQIYVSCGTGYWGPPMRLGAPAEITLIELRSTQA